MNRVFSRFRKDVGFTRSLCSTSSKSRWDFEEGEKEKQVSDHETLKKFVISVKDSVLQLSDSYMHCLSQKGFRYSVGRSKLPGEFETLINTDASINITRGGKGKAAIAAMARVHGGKFLHGEGCCLGTKTVGDILLCEAKGILLGVKIGNKLLVAHKSIDNRALADKYIGNSLSLQSDCLNVVTAVKNNSRPPSFKKVVKEIVEKKGSIGIDYCPRLCNAAADALAKYVCGFEDGKREDFKYATLPGNVKVAIEEDMQRTPRYSLRDKTETIFE